MGCDASRPVAGLVAVVLHVAGYDLPGLSVPSVYVAAIGSTPIAVPYLVVPRRTSLEGCEAAVLETWLSFHRTDPP
jgi:hypothetical protein